VPCFPVVQFAYTTTNTSGCSSCFLLPLSLLQHSIFSIQSQHPIPLTGASSRAEMLFVFYWVRLGPATLSLPALASSQLFHPELLTQDFALTGIIQSPVGQSFLPATQHLQAPSPGSISNNIDCQVASQSFSPKIMTLPPNSP